MHTQLHALADQTGQFIVMPLKELQKQGFDVEWHIDTWMRYVILAGFSRLLAEAVLRVIWGRLERCSTFPIFDTSSMKATAFLIDPLM